LIFGFVMIIILCNLFSCFSFLDLFFQLMVMMIKLRLVSQHSQ
jgi:hypothetical protein